MRRYKDKGKIFEVIGEEGGIKYRWVDHSGTTFGWYKTERVAAITTYIRDCGLEEITFKTYVDKVL